MTDYKRTVQVTTSEILQDVIEHHDQLLAFLKATYDSPMGARLGLSHILGMYFGDDNAFFSVGEGGKGEDGGKYLSYMETILAAVWLLDKDAILVSLKDGTYLEKWHDKVLATINKVSEEGPQETQHHSEPDPLGAWLKRVKKT